MAIAHLEEAKQLRQEGNRLGRAGMSQRAHDLIAEYIAKNPDGHYKDCIELVGRIHAIYLATKSNCYWREKANHGYTKELRDIKRFNPPPCKIER